MDSITFSPLTNSNLSVVISTSTVTIDPKMVILTEIAIVGVKLKRNSLVCPLHQLNFIERKGVESVSQYIL
jgi:hypothetical protein